MSNTETSTELPAALDKKLFTFKTDGLDAKDYTTKFVKAAFTNNKDDVEFFVMQGYSANLQNANGDNPVMAACAAGHVGVLTYLLRHGGEPDFKNNDGITPLMFAVGNGKIDIVRMLVNAGADKSIKNNDGMNAADIAKMMNFGEAIELLKEDF
jgi:ankyrin repeat protein